MNNPSKAYYNREAINYFEKTFSVKPLDAWHHFLSFLSPNAHILDAGCGSGRDSKYFLEKGYKVTSIDISEKLATLASAYIGQEVSVRSFSDINEVNIYDAVWCYASLLHVTLEDLDAVFLRIQKALKDNGILFMSFKHGDVNHVTKCGRFYYDMNDKRFEALNLTSKGWCVEKVWIQPCPQITEENRPDWYTVILRKI